MQLTYRGIAYQPQTTQIISSLPKQSGIYRGQMSQLSLATPVVRQCLVAFIYRGVSYIQYTGDRLNQPAIDKYRQSADL